MSWRRLSVLLSQLPREARFVRVVDPRAAWSTTDYLLARIGDLIASGNWQRGGGKGGRPKPLKRPGADGAKKYGKAVPMAHARDLLDKWKRGEVRHGSRARNGLRQHRPVRTELR